MSSSSSLAADHVALVDAVREAGAEVMRHYREQCFDAWTKDDASPITDADLAANEILHKRLIGIDREHYGWLSEESADDAKRIQADRVWIVDPIDGTRAFIEKRPEFTVCAALVIAGEVVISAIYNPLTDEFFEAIKGSGARCNGQPLQHSGCKALEKCNILGKPPMFGHPGWPRPWPQMAISYRSSTSYRMALVACGAQDAALALLPKADWDVAPGTLLLEEVGAQVSDHHGKSFRFNAPEPWQRALVCATPDLYPQLLSRLDHLPADLRELSL
ncbi:MAG: 3'(2'),5'-bisphosphate nucleotidase CysQ [Pseudomonadota bacterium]